MRNVITKVSLAAALALGLQLSANATSFDLGVISGTETIKAVTTTGSFDDLYTFSTPVSSFGGLAATSIVFESIYGVTVSRANVYVGAYTNVSQLMGASKVSAPTKTTSTGSDTATIITLATSATFLPSTTYTFQIGGTSIGNAGYTGIIALIDGPKVLPAVPEPETYAMLLAGLGMMGMIARRRQKNR